MVRAKVTQEAAIKIEAARSEAVKHQAAGEFEACVIAARKALAVSGR